MNEQPNVQVSDLFELIGRQQVEIAVLRRQIAQLQAELQANNPKPVKPGTEPPKPKVVK